jgi:hypothetical protein
MGEEREQEERGCERGSSVAYHINTLKKFKG